MSMLCARALTAAAAAAPVASGARRSSAALPPPPPAARTAAAAPRRVACAASRAAAGGRGVAPPRRGVVARGGAATTGEWWTAHADVFADVADSDALQALLSKAPAGQVVVLEWLSPSCKHCEAALESTAASATLLRGEGAPVSFARVTCAAPGSKALAKAAGVKALPTLSLFRAGAKLLEFTPSQRGTPEQAARRLADVIATVAADTRSPQQVHFVMMAGDARAVDGPAPVAPPKFDYAAMRAAAAAELKAAAAAQKGDDEDECDAREDDEECGVKW